MQRAVQRPVQPARATIAQSPDPSPHARLAGRGTAPAPAPPPDETAARRPAPDPAQAPRPDRVATGSGRLSCARTGIGRPSCCATGTRFTVICARAPAPLSPARSAQDRTKSPRSAAGTAASTGSVTKICAIGICPPPLQRPFVFRDESRKSHLRPLSARANLATQAVPCPPDRFSHRPTGRSSIAICGKMAKVRATSTGESIGE